MQYNPFYYLENPEFMHYEYVWVNYIKNGVIVENTIPEEIIKSWMRCREYRVDAMLRSIPRTKIDHLEIERRIKNNRQLLNISIPIMEMLIDIVDEKDLCVQIVDVDGYVLSKISKGSLLTGSDYFGSVGYHLDERLIGTNCYLLAMMHSKPMELVGAEHYCEVFQKMAVYASPVYSRSGDIVAVVGMTVQLEKSNRYMLGMITATAKAIENEYQLNETHQQLIKQNEEIKLVLNSVTDGIVYVDENNTITQANLEMQTMTGLKREDMIGKKVNIIQTNPKINLVISSFRKGEASSKIQIIGESKSYNCIVDHKLINNNHNVNSSNLVLFFIKYEEIQSLADKVSQENRAFFTFDDILGKSKSLLDAIELAQKAAEHNVRVLITGESGTGKEMFAQAIHNYGQRRKGPFVAVDCGAIPRELLESELFGYEEGSYTGARKGGHRGKFEIAHRGTLFLDEISNMPIDMQSKLLRVLQDNKIFRIGGYHPIAVDVQIIAATNKDLQKEVEKGNFREDLFYRLNTVYIILPSLRERIGDIEVLVKQIIYNNNQLFQKKIKGVEEEAMDILLKYDWPGNVRQLNNIIERMMLMARKDIITTDLIPEEIHNFTDVTTPQSNMLVETLDVMEAKYIKMVLDENDGNIKKTAELLNVTRATIYRTLKKHGLMEKEN